MNPHSPRCLRTLALAAALFTALPLGAIARDLPDPPPDELKLRVDVRGASKSPGGSLRARKEAMQKRTLLLHRYTVRADDFLLLLWNKENGYTPTAPAPAVRTYRGTTEENPNERVVGVLYPDGTFQAEASTGVKRVWNIPKAIDVSSQVRGEAGTDDGRSRWRGSVIERDPGVAPLTKFPPVRRMKRAQLGADITQRCIGRLGGWEAALAWTEWQTSMTDEFYTRDLALSFEASCTIVRLDRLYPEQVGPPVLKQLSAHWKEKHTELNWDYVNAFLGPSAGLSSVGGPFSYGPPIHEVGHSISLEHGIFGIDMQNPVNHDKALHHFEKRGLLEKFDDAPPATNPDPVRPFTAPDIVVTGPGEPVRIHVLGNDFDANNERIAIDFFTERTVPGGTVKKISHKEKSGNELDALGYIPPRGYVGKDLIIYSLVNESGFRQPQLAHVYIVDGQAKYAAHWPFDRASEGQTEDVEKQRFHARIPAGTETIEGPVGSALQLPPGTQIVCGDADLLPERPKYFKPGYKDKWGWYPLEESAGNYFDPLNLSYTAAFWVRAPAYPGGEVEIEIEGSTERETTPGGSLLEKTDTNLSAAVGFRVLGTPEGLQLYVREFTGALSGGDATKKIITHQDALKPGTWHHVAMVVDRKSDTAALYLDGKKSEDEIGLLKDSWIFAGRNDLRLLSHPDAATAFDDLHIAYRALSAREIQDLAKSLRVAP